MSLDKAILNTAWKCKCPRCNEGKLYESKLSVDLKGKCKICGLDFSRTDSADGPAVFLIFLLGFALVPLAILLEFSVHPPLWLHGVLWGALALGITIGLLRPVKAYMVALQYKHRPDMFEQ